MSALENNLLVIEGENSQTSKHMNESDLLFFNLLNHFRTLAVFLNLFVLVVLIMEPLMSSRIFLLMTTILHFDGFIRQHVEWTEKFGLWSFSMINTSFVANFCYFGRLRIMFSYGFVIWFLEGFCDILLNQFIVGRRVHGLEFCGLVCGN